MHAPIELGPRLYGVLSVAGPPGFDEAGLELLTRLASGSAAAIANAIDFQRERHIARSLTLGFVPVSLPRLPDYETGLLYAPALGEATGGDLYGLWQLPCGQVAVLVGDVAGKGVETAALSSMVRFFIEARSWDAESPARVLEQTNAMLTGRLPSDTFVTAFLAVMGPRSLKWASAGHLPPFHLAGGGTERAGGDGSPARASRRALAMSSARSNSVTATSCSPTRTGWSRPAAARRSSAPHALLRSSRGSLGVTLLNSWQRGCTRKWSPGAAAWATTWWRSPCGGASAALAARSA